MNSEIDVENPSGDQCYRLANGVADSITMALHTGGNVSRGCPQTNFQNTHVQAASLPPIVLREIEVTLLKPPSI